MCEKRMPLIKKRHDAAHKILSDTLKNEFPSDRHLVDQTADPGTSQGTLRPDETLILGTGKVFIIDVKTPFPVRKLNGRTFIETSDMKNKTKYEALRLGYSRKYRECHVDTLIIPSAGPIPKLSFNTLRNTGLSKSIVNKTLKRISIATTRANVALLSTLRSPPVS
jgi:hypothetical protein